MIKSFLTRKTTQRRILFFILGDCIFLSLSLYLAFYLRFDGRIPPEYLEDFSWYLAVFLTVKLTIFSFFRLYRMSWSYVGFYEILDILKATAVSLFVLLGIVFMLWSRGLFQGFPRSVPLIDYVISLVFVGLFRASKRSYKQIRSGRNQFGKKRTLIIGAGNAGEQIVRDMRRQKDCPYIPVGFVDDHEMKRGVYIQGVRVLGNRKEIPGLVDKLSIDLILLAIPSASSREIREILSWVRKSSVKEKKTIPGLNELVDRNISLSDIKEIRIEDILGREQVSVDKKVVEGFIQEKTILVTGAGGSIGSELVRQVLSLAPQRVIALDIDETELFELEMEMGRKGTSSRLLCLVANIQDKHKIETALCAYRPDYVFHAAAYKHVPIMERYPEEAVKVNIMGTKIVAEASISCGVKKFVMVSTDKAVKPTNIMGATKSVAEKMVKAFNSTSQTHFISVRFGNVVGSRGSVIPIFEEQIRKGGPVTVTHREMRRYFMSIPEACILTLEAAAMGTGGEVFVLDMGEPIKILDMAKEIIRLNGLEPETDIPIVFTGIRPGEKLYEEVLGDKEGIGPTTHPKIFIGKDESDDCDGLLRKAELFEEIIRNNQWAWIRNLLRDLVPSYNPSYRDGDSLGSPEQDKNVSGTKLENIA